MDETQIDIRSIIGLLHRRIKLILITFIIVVGTAAVYAFSLTPTFTASSLILVDTKATEILDPSAPISNISGDNARIDSEVEILKSDNILLSVIEKQNLITNPEFGAKLSWRDKFMTFFRIKNTEKPTGEQALQSVLNSLKKAISVKRKGLTYLISVSAASISPQTSAKIANALSNAYIEAQVQSKVENILRARDILQAQMNAANEAIIKAEQSFDDFITNNIDSITAQTGRIDIAQMRQELEKLISNRNKNINNIDNIEQDISLKNWTLVAKNLQDDALAELQRQRDQLSSDLAKASGGSQLAIDLRAELAKIDDDLAKIANDGLSNLKQSIAGDQAKASQLRQQIRSSVLNSNLPADILTQIYSLQQNAQIARNQYQTLLTRINELEAQAQTQVAYSRVVSQALPPSKPSYPNKRLILLLAGISALGLGIGLAFLYENYVGGFSSEEQVENVLHLPVVASIPHVNVPVIDGKKQNHLSPAEFIYSEPLSAYSEAFRRLRLSIDNIKADKKDKVSGGTVIMVSSAVPGEGKSTIALSLGRTLAQSGQHALIIDCDLRKPSLHRYLDIERSVGIADYLLDSNESDILSQVIVNDKEKPLSAIIGSKRSKIPTDQLSSGAVLARLIKNAKKQFKYVILDSPPIIPIIDGLYLADHADIIIMVTRFATTSQGEAKEAISLLNSVKRENTKIISVFNQEEGGIHGYKGKYAGYYDNY